MTNNSGSSSRKKPYTSAEYLESLRDGREIWIYGERVKDVTTHPAFRNTVRMMGRLYDALHDSRKDILCAETDTGSGGYTHKFFKAPRTVDEMVGSRDAIAEWARVTYGWMGRSPDYKAAFLATLGANSDYYAPFDENARPLVQKGSGRSDVRESRHRESSGRSQQGIVRSARRLHAC
jgi:4-hydroxyphenylacetate 3-monooxygenase